MGVRRVQRRVGCNHVSATPADATSSGDAAGGYGGAFGAVEAVKAKTECVPVGTSAALPICCGDWQAKDCYSALDASTFASVDRRGDAGLFRAAAAEDAEGDKLSLPQCKNTDEGRFEYQI